MCLIKTHRYPKLAKNDIPVYKFVASHYNNTDTFESENKHFIYTKGMTYSQISGFLWAVYNIIKKNINRGFHSYTDSLPRSFVKHYGMNNGMLYLSCTIPKGSYYFEGTYDIVSSKIKIEEIITLENYDRIFKTKENVHAQGT